jgi:predicted  nucleic acid-binding Zn-ribbon protein/predicted RNA-binding Zn-ribbon protein involved in translation (DUF1610 family)
MKRLIIAITTIAGSFLTGYGVSSYFSKNLASTIGVATGGGLFGAGLTYMIMDNRHIHIKNNLQNKLDSLTTDFNNLKRSKAELETSKAKISSMLTSANELIGQLKLEIGDLTDTKEDYHAVILSLESKLAETQKQLENAIAQRNEFKATAEFKESELTAFEREFTDTVNQKASELYQARLDKEVERVTLEQFALLQETIDTLQQMSAFTGKVYNRHQTQREYALGLTEDFHAFKSKCDESKQRAYDELLSVNAGLNQQLALLSQKLADGMTEPEYKDFGLASVEGRIINGFVEWCYRHLQTPFRVLAFDSSEDITSFGLDYPKSQSPENIVSTLQSHIETLAKFLGIFKIVRVEYLAKYDCIAVSYRHTAPKPDSDDDIFKAGLLPRSMFCDAIFKATDHTTSGKPTLRIMAATGEGKGICTKHIVAYFAELEGWETWISDPIHGSEQDYWDCPKLAKDKAQAKKAYGDFAKLHATRKDLKIDGFTSNFVLGIFDEFDKQHEDDDKETAAKIMTAIRHTKQRQILIGQTAEVGSNGWKWDDMKQCSLLVLGESIGTLCKHLVKDLGWTLKKSNEVKRQYEKFSDWASKKNDSNPDLPPENITRIGLLVTGSKFQFLELPIPHKGIIRSERVRSSLSINTQNQTILNNIEGWEDESKKAFVVPHIECPDCGSTEFTRKSKVADPTMHSYICKSCKTRFTSYNNKPANSN